jgi:hypothetical protein
MNHGLFAVASIQMEATMIKRKSADPTPPDAAPLGAAQVACDRTKPAVQARAGGKR